MLAQIADSNGSVTYLLATMSNDAVDLRLRVGAAKALLSHQAKQTKKHRAAAASETTHLGTDWEGLHEPLDINCLDDLFDRVK